MARWILKAVGARTMSLLPAGQRWHYFAQKRLTRSLRLDSADVERRLTRCRQHLDDYFGHSSAAEGAFTALELGTGWFPFTPIGLFLCGAAEVLTVDRNRFLRPPHVEQVLDLLIQFSDDGGLQSHLPLVKTERLEQLRRVREISGDKSVEAVLGELAIEVQVNDVRQLELARASVDLICSDGTLQYIARPVLEEILLKFERVARDSAVMSHEIGLKDAFAIFDPSIGPLNYLRLSDGMWRALGEPQNRLRISDYRLLHEKAGWRILSEENVELAPEEELADIRLARRFQQYAPDDLRVIKSRVVSVPTRSSLRAGMGLSQAGRSEERAGE